MIDQKLRPRFTESADEEELHSLRSNKARLTQIVQGGYGLHS
jgi:hypothetical protein